MGKVSREIKMSRKLTSVAEKGEIQREVVVQKWEESEAGWGTRPDGFTIHLNDEDRKTFIKKYWARMPDEAPDEYSRPSGTPYKAYVDEKTYAKLKKSKNGIWGNGNNYPGSGGTNGWLSSSRPVSPLA